MTKASLDKDQNFWQLASIQATALGFPVIVIGGQLAQQYGSLTAIAGILIGNLILWVIALSIIWMTTDARTDAIQTVNVYLGKTGALLASFVLFIAFLSWFTMQLKYGTLAIESLLTPSHSWPSAMSLRVGTSFGFLTAFAAFKGIRLIKWLGTILLPLFCLYFIYLLFLQPFQDFCPPSSETFALSPIISSVAIILPGTINLPTFFRHAKSKYDAIFGLSIMTILVPLFQIFSVLLGFCNPHQLAFPNTSFFFKTTSLLFSVSSLIMINLVNIYLASAAWKWLTGKRAQPHHLGFIGLLGTAAYTFIQTLAPMTYIENIASIFIASLGIVLLIGFMMRYIVHHRPRHFEQMINVICWLFSSFLSSLFYFFHSKDMPTSLLFALAITSCIYILILLFEELIWSIRTVIKEYHHDKHS